MATIKERQLIYSLYAQGASMSEISLAVPEYSRSAVSGYIGRAIQKNLIKRRCAPEPKDQPRKAPAKYNHIALTISRRSSESKPIEMENESIGKLTIMDLQKNSCRYICSNGLYCGEEMIIIEKNKHNSYCKEHHKLCWK